MPIQVHLLTLPYPTLPQPTLSQPTLPYLLLHLPYPLCTFLFLFEALLTAPHALFGSLNRSPYSLSPCSTSPYHLVPTLPNSRVLKCRNHFAVPQSAHWRVPFSFFNFPPRQLGGFPTHTHTHTLPRRLLHFCIHSISLSILVPRVPSPTSTPHPTPSIVGEVPYTV